MQGLSIAILFAVAVGVALAQDTCPVVDVAVYKMENLPLPCYQGFSTCSSQACSCVGMTYDSAAMDCKPISQQSPPPSCSDLPQCLKTYITCVNGAFVATEDAGLASNCTAFADTINFFHTQALQTVVNPDSFNSTDLFASCSSFLCDLSNATGCTLNDNDLCVAPSGISEPITAVPGSTPAPTNADGTYAVATKVVQIKVKFQADFDSLVSTSAGRQQIKTIMSDSLTKKLKYKTNAKKMKYTSSTGAVTEERRKNHLLAAGDLEVSAEAAIPASDTATLNSVENNVNSLKSDTSTTWFSSLASACGCSIPAPTVTSQTVDVAAPGSGSSKSSAACSSGCIAGVIVGGTAAVAIGVGAVAYTSMKKGSAVAPDPSN